MSIVEAALILIIAVTLIADGLGIIRIRF